MQQAALKGQDSTLKALLNTAYRPEQVRLDGVMMQITEKLSSHVFSKLASLLKYSMAGMLVQIIPVSPKFYGPSRRTVGLLRGRLL